MPSSAGPSRRNTLLLLALALVAAIIYVSTSHSDAPSTTNNLRHAAQQALTPNPKPTTSHPDLPTHAAALDGHPIMPKLGNETAKADLGRSAWKLFHTIMARYPDTPSGDEQAALKSYLHLFVRLYPCGECAEHFRAIVDKFPPQVSSRSAAAAWGCHVHNEVNKSLGKEVFDCAKIGDFYDCGCAEDEEEGKGEGEEVRRESGKAEMSRERVEQITGDRGRDFNGGLLTGEDLGRLTGAG